LNACASPKGTVVFVGIRNEAGEMMKAYIKMMEWEQGKRKENEK
jgi:hypothetical protein